MLRGDTDINKFNSKIWDMYTSREHLDSKNMSKFHPEGELGPGYGWQFRYCGAVHPVNAWIKYCEELLEENNVDMTIEYNKKDFRKQYEEFRDEHIMKLLNKNKYKDQLQYVIDELNNNSNSRYALINLWNPNNLESMSLPPCHFVYHFYKHGKWLDLSLTQRSADLMLGVPFNIFNATLFAHIVGYYTNSIPRFLTHHTNHTHIYKNHLENAKLQIDNRSLLSIEKPLFKVLKLQFAKLIYAYHR